MRRPETPTSVKGRGTTAQPANRFASERTEAVDDGWVPDWFDADGEPAPHPQTRVTDERARSVISHNDSPDVGFSASINPFRGCEHGCVYCFARPSHAYLDLSPGLDFETKLYAKTNAVEKLRAELAKPNYRPVPIALGINTDAYQPIERRYRITRGVLEVLAQTRHPVSIITKSALVERDIDLLAPMARDGLVNVYFSVTTLDNRLAAKMEPRASAPHAKLRAMRALRDAGVPVGVMVAPVIPAMTDHEMETILEVARDSGAASASYVLLRLPHELKEIFPRLVVAAIPRARRTRDEPDPADARRQGLRSDLRQAHARRRPVRAAAASALRSGDPAARLRPSAGATLRTVPVATAFVATGQPVLEPCSFGDA